MFQSFHLSTDFYFTTLFIILLISEEYVMNCKVCEEERCILHATGFMCEIGGWGKSLIEEVQITKGKLIYQLSKYRFLIVIKDKVPSNLKGRLHLPSQWKQEQLENWRIFFSCFENQFLFHFFLNLVIPPLLKFSMTS